ncbi:MAG: hypothetical protein EBS94_13975 [Proteobacteria bacterium]|nr:hypothetical protein [Pseudomonadota bacterium]
MSGMRGLHSLKYWSASETSSETHALRPCPDIGQSSVIAIVPRAIPSKPVRPSSLFSNVGVNPSLST